MKKIWELILNFIYFESIVIDLFSQNLISYIGKFSYNVLKLSAGFFVFEI